MQNSHPASGARALPQHSTSPEFSEVEKLALDLAVGMTTQSFAGEGFCVRPEVLQTA